MLLNNNIFNVGAMRATDFENRAKVVKKISSTNYTLGIGRAIAWLWL